MTLADLDDIAATIERNDCTAEDRARAAELIREQRKLLLAMRDDATKAWYAAATDLRRDTMMYGECPECGIAGGHTEGCMVGMRSVLAGFEHANKKTREVLGLKPGEKLTEALQAVHEGKRMLGVEVVGYLHDYGVKGLQEATAAGRKQWSTPCNPSPIFGKESVPVYIAKPST